LELIPCNNCGGGSFRLIHQKASNLGEIFSIQKCKNCGLVQVNPQPSFDEVMKYYSDDYFTKRSDRGYDNYYSDSIRKEIERVFQLNLQDLQFFPWEENLLGTRETLDIGCAAGYFVNYMRSRGWNARGIEIAKGPVQFAREALGLDIIEQDFLNWDKDTNTKFHFITLWASIEHLHKPKETLEKIFQHLYPGGRLILSTCRYGLLSQFKGLNWRYLNVPEHLYYYTLELLVAQLESIGYTHIKHITYGSGMTMKKNATPFFKVSKKIIDFSVKLLDQGDMMALHFRKP
jgi:2-polyprenyl-3-methyl-5-hydroxy-6-metoxy-1,4-benzoquinol methylase